MKWSLRSLLRTLTWMAAGIIVLAVGLGRYAPRARPSYHAAAVRYHGVNMHCSPEQRTRPCFLDRETGQVRPIGFPPEDSLDYATCSPWRDEQGQFQVVARWMRQAGSEFEHLPQEFGVARFTLPEGRLIDRVMLDQLPTGEPCWVPGEPPRVVFSAGDGVIYSYRFEESNRDLFGPPLDRARAQPLVWRTTPPGNGLLYIKDLTWPAEKPLGGRLIASLSYREEVNGKRRMSRHELWWLQLSDDLTAIEATGRLMVPDLEDDQGAADRGEQRLPNVASTANGDLVMTYLSRENSQSLWDLRVALITIDPATGAPTVRRGCDQRVGGGFLPSTPTFSADGRWIYGVRNHDPGYSQLAVQRYSAADVLALADGAPRRSGVARAEAAVLAPATVMRADASSRWPNFPRADATPLLGWANLGVFDPKWLVKLGTERHAGE